MTYTKLAFIFPGQGSQSVGMGKEFHDSWAYARRCFETADEVCEAPISKLCFEGPYEELTRTEFAQPALFTVSCICLEYAKERGLEASVAAGHSLGEFAALVAAESVDFDTGLELVSLRARLMQDAVGTEDGMSAVLGLPLERVSKIAAAYERVDVANVNCPGQVVLSGSRAQLAEAQERLVEAGAKRVVPLAVAGAFHTVAMQRANDTFLEALSKVTFADPVIPVVQNATGKATKKASAIALNLKKQMTSPVLWQQCAEVMERMGVTSYVELGPGKVLKGLVERSVRGAHVWSVDEPEAVYEIEEMMLDA